jgi:threonine dehydrogenase-like Zn-dependent dehydrogenase
MVGLDTHPEARGPMVVADTSTGGLTLSFEFAAVGDVDQDVPKAMRILRQAIEATVSEGAIDVVGTPTEGWASQPGPRQVDLVYA